MKYTMRPLSGWPGPKTPPTQRRGAHAFKASWQSTLDLLGRELEHLKAQNVVLQVDVREGDIRADGMLRTNAKVARSGVRIAFDSKHGPLTYATDVYEAGYSRSSHQPWQANVRAIALALEALRAVDRYGVTRSGEQYTGWRAIESAAPAGFPTVDAAAAWMVGRAVATGWAARVAASDVAIGGEDFKNVYRVLVRALHPDRGGDPDEWAWLDQARQLIEGARP